MKLLLKIVGALLGSLLILALGFAIYFKRSHAIAQASADEVCQGFSVGTKFDQRRFESAVEDRSGNFRCGDSNQGGGCRVGAAADKRNFVAIAYFPYFIRAWVECEITVEGGSITKARTAEFVD